MERRRFVIPPSSLFAPQVGVGQPVQVNQVDQLGSTLRELTFAQKVALSIHGIMLIAVTYHGYKRNGNSVPYGLAWGLGGLLCPTVTLAFALTQGFARRARG